MQRLRITAIAVVFAVLGLAGALWANVRLRIPEDIEPPYYTSGCGPSRFSDGTIFSVHDDEWAAIPFSRSPECVPVDFNLLDQFDIPAVFFCPLLVEGFTVWNDLSDPAPILEECHGLGAVPVWFVRWSELQTAMGDGELTILELASLDSLLVGTASLYQYQNHIHDVHQVSHLTVVAQGTLEDGRSFQLSAVEVGLELEEVRIDFE